MLYFLLWREVKGRYRQMAVGPLWIVIAPLAKLPSEGIPYPIFTYVALLGAGTAPNWTLSVAIGGVLVALVTGAFYFRRTERTIVDVL